MARGVRNTFEQTSEQLAHELVDVIDMLPEEEVPFGGAELTPEQQYQDYVKIRGSREEWDRLLDERGLEPVMRYARKFERRYRKNEQSADRGDAGIGELGNAGPRR